MHLIRSLHPRTLLSLSLPALFSTMTTPTPAPPSSSSSATSPPTYPTYRYQPRHSSWPYTARDFLREDETPDTDFYSSPRFVTHIDDNAISLLREYYAHNLPRTGRILDFCSSWISHYPPELEKRAIATAKRIQKQKEQQKAGGEAGNAVGSRDSAATDSDTLEITGLGINAAELSSNPILSHRLLIDLNTHPSIPDPPLPYTASTCTVSIDYLTSPLALLSSVRAASAPGARIHLVISNRCFPTKAVGRWLRVGEQERLKMVGDYLWWSGWREVEVVTVCDGKAEEGAGWLGGLLGVGRRDPLWVVRGRNVVGSGEEGREEL